MGSLIRNPTDWEPSCAIQTAHAKASNIVYGSDDLSSMEREGWQRLGKYTVDPWWTKDEADLWERSGECILAFRGSNDQSPDGTFKGTNLFNSLWHPEESRMLVVDFTHSLPSPEYKHIKMKHEFFMTSGGDRIIVPASEQIPADITLQGAREYFGIAVWEINELHSQSKYIDATSECGA